MVTFLQLSFSFENLPLEFDLGTPMDFAFGEVLQAGEQSNRKTEEKDRETIEMLKENYRR